MEETSSSSSSSSGKGWICPFKGFHVCSCGLDSNKVFPRLVAHLKSHHLSSDERKDVLRAALSSDLDLFKKVNATLKELGQWICGPCMVLHASNRFCHHPDGIVRFIEKSGVLGDRIIGLHVPDLHQREVGVGEEMVLDVELLDKLFRLPTSTVKSIPFGCRMAFSHALKSALVKVEAHPESVEAWVRLLLLPRCTLQVFKPTNRRDCRSGNRRSEQNHRILKSLAMWGQEDGIVTLVQNLLDNVVTGDVKVGRQDVVPKRREGNVNVKQCLRKVSDGHFSAAIKVLGSSGVAPFGGPTLRALEIKHPFKPPPSLPVVSSSEPPLVVDGCSILECIKSFPKGTSCGRDGLRAQHLVDAMCGERSTMATELVSAITAVVNLWLQGRCPLVLGEFVASAPLTPLLKPDNSIRPIAVGTIWRRLVSKVAMKGVSKNMSDYLKDFQFGVGIPGGAEAILHSVNRVLAECHTDGSLSLLAVDFRNAFNLVDRSALLREVRSKCPTISPWVEFLYGQASRLYVGNEVIWSSTGVQQGDPLGPLLFALALHPLILNIRDNCRLLLHAWYLDDGTIIGKTEEVAKVLTIIKVAGPELGLELNIQKTELFWPTVDRKRDCSAIFPSNIGRPLLGIKLLGGAVSRDEGFIRDLVMKRAVKAVDLMGLLPQLGDPQSELLLLRSCMGIAKLFFGLRTCQPVHHRDAALYFDKGLRDAVEDIVVSGGPFFGDLQWRLASLPIKFGGLGLYSAVEASSYAFVASRAQSWGLQNHILRNCDIRGLDEDYGHALDCLRCVIPTFDLNDFTNSTTVPPKSQSVLASVVFSKIVQDLPSNFILTVRQKAVFECLRAPHAQDFLRTIPIDGLGQHMSPVEYRSILKYRLMIPIFPTDEVCPVCRKACLDTFGEHALHCKELPGFKYRHDMVRDVLFDVFKRAGVPVKKEAPVSFLTDPAEGRSSLRPADIMVFGWVGGKHACVDVTGVSPLVGLGNGSFKMGEAALKAAAGKVTKHERACIQNQHEFVPFAFDTFGFLAPDAVTLLKRVQRVLRDQVTSARCLEYVFSRIGFAIQKGIAAQLVARLPSIGL